MQSPSIEHLKEVLRASADLRATTSAFDHARVAAIAFIRRLDRYKETRADEIAMLDENLAMLPAVSELAETVSLPIELAAAMATQRPELIKLQRPGPMNEAQSAAICHAIGVLIQTNMMLQQRAGLMGDVARDLRAQMKGVAHGLFRLEMMADGEISISAEVDLTGAEDA